MSTNESNTQVDKSKIWKMGGLAIVASIVANLAAFFLIGVLVDLPSSADFPPLSAGAIAFLTALFTFFGVVAFAIVVRIAKNPIRTYWIVATIAFVLSLIPNILGALDPESAPFPFAEPSAMAFTVLIIFHVIAYLVTTVILTTQTTAD